MLFDASKYPGYEEGAKKGMRIATLFILNAMIGPPVVFTIVWILLKVNSFAESDLLILGCLFIASAVADEFILHYLVRPRIVGPVKFPARVTGSGLEYSGKLIPRDALRKIEVGRQDAFVTVAGRMNVIIIPIARIGSVEEFIAAIRQIAPGIAFRDFRIRWIP